MQPYAAHEQRPPPTPPAETATMKLDPSSLRPQARKHIWVITGPAGCGKTSVAEFLHASYALPYIEGDLFHPPENVQKMAAGQPLTDADRWGWLIVLREAALRALETADGVIVTCSALKRRYRDVMRVAAYHHPDVAVHFVFLAATEALLLARVRARQDHFMKDSMVRSQFESLEAPQADEFDILLVDASGDSKAVQDLARGAVGGIMNHA